MRTRSMRLNDEETTQSDRNHVIPNNKTVQNEKSLEDIYANVRSIPSFSSKIGEFLRKNETASVHKQIRRKFRRRKIVAYYPYEICMADLAFFTGYGMARANNGFKYVLVFIDVFTKMCYVEPMKDKRGLTALMAFENIFRRLPEIPNHIVTDVGTEFYNRDVSKLFTENAVNHYSIRGTHKASVAERMIRTLKGRIEKFLWQNKTKRYIDVLQQIVDNYNKTPHRAIGMPPVDVDFTNRAAVFKKLYKNFNDRSQPKLHVGDKVRIAKNKTIFDKGYTRQWSLELYTIVSAESRDGIDYYRIEDENGIRLPRQRYYYELNLVYKHDEPEALLLHQ